MENNQSHPAPDSDTPATEADLKAFVRQNRQHLPPLPEPVKIAPLKLLDPEEVALREAREVQRALARCRSEREGWYMALVRSAGTRYGDCTLDSFQVSNDRQRGVVTTVRAYVDSLRDAWEWNGLVLYGPVGTGKDHLAFAVARIAIDELGKRAQWLKCQDWFGAIRDNMDGRQGECRTERAIIGEYASVPLLVISDPLPPVGSLSQHQATMLYRLVETRYSKALPTICTVNVKDDAEADARMGAATWDRLTDGAWKISCNWPSHRTPHGTI